MIQTDYSPDKFWTYLSHPESQGGGIDHLEEEFSCILMPSQITDVFYANFIQWAHARVFFSACPKNLIMKQFPFECDYF